LRSKLILAECLRRMMAELTSVDDVILVEIIDRFKDLPDGLGSVLLGEFALLTNAVEQLSTSRQLGYNVVFVLRDVSFTAQHVLSPRSLPSIRTSRGT
jgi:hypothetical protein